MIGGMEANAHSFDIRDVLNADANRPKLEAGLPHWMTSPGQHDIKVQYENTDVLLSPNIFPSVDRARFGGRDAVRFGQASAFAKENRSVQSAPVSLREQSPSLRRTSMERSTTISATSTPDLPVPFNPLSPILAVSGLGEMVAGTVLRKAGKKFNSPLSMSIGARLQGAGVITEAAALTVACTPGYTETAPAPIVLEYQAADGTHPETARLIDVSLNNLDSSLAGVDLSKAPEAKADFSALRDSISQSKDHPILLVVDGKLVNLTISNPQDVRASFERVSDGKEFSLDFGITPLPITDAGGKEHFLVAFQNADGTVVVRQAVWDKSEVSKDGITVGTLRVLEWNTGETTANAALLMAVINQDSAPNQTQWILVDPQTQNRLTLDGQEVIAVQPTPAFSEVLFKLGSEPQYVSDSGVQLPPSVETLPANVVITPTAPVEAPTAVPTPTEVSVGAIDPKYPEAGPRPEGATGHDSKTGEWTKPNPENPDKPFFYKTVTDPKRNEVLTQGWYHDIIINPTYQGGIPFFNQPDSFPNYMALHVWCEEGLKCPSIQHLPSKTKNDTDLTFNRLLETVLSNRFKKEYSPHVSGTPYFSEDLFAGKISIPFTTAHGDSYEYKIRPESSMNIYLKKTDLTNPDLSYHYIHASISGDDQGNVNAVEYIPQPDWTVNGYFMYFNFAYPFTMFFTDDMSQGSFLNHMSSPGLAGLLDLFTQGPNAYIQHQ